MRAAVVREHGPIESIASSPEKLERLRQIGADHSLDYTERDMRSATCAMSGPSNTI